MAKIVIVFLMLMGVLAGSYFAFLPLTPSQKWVVVKWFFGITLFALIASAILATLVYLF